MGKRDISPDRPDVLLAQHIETEITDLRLGENLFHGPVSPGNQEAVYVFADSGASPMNYLQDYKVLWKPQIRIFIRGDRASYSDGFELARCVRNVVHHASIGLVDVELLDSEPAYLGESDDGNHEWLLIADVLQQATIENL